MHIKGVVPSKPNTEISNFRNSVPLMEALLLFHPWTDFCLADYCLFLP